MDKNTEAFFNLIRQSQFDDIDLPDPSSVDWNYIYEEAKAQTVLGIIAPLVPEEITQKDTRWREAIDRQTASYIQYLFAEEELVKLLDANQIPYVIFKGNASAVYYRNPARRQMGDIDILVPSEKLQKSKTLLLKNGYHLIHTSDLGNNTPQNFKSDALVSLNDNINGKAPRDIDFEKNGIIYELHSRVSHDDVSIEIFTKNAFDNQIQKTIFTHSFMTFSELSTGVILLDHIRAHLKQAIGLRQVIDWMMYVNQQLDDDSWYTCFQPVIQKTKMEKLAITTTKMCQIYFGLDSQITWCNSADEEICKKLMTNLLSNGNFGRKDDSGLAIENAISVLKSDGFFRTLQSRGERNWDAYKKHHWLKPFAWLYQLLRYITRGIKTKRHVKQLVQDNNRGQLKSELLVELEL